MVTKTLVRVSDGAIMSTVAVTAPNDENRNNHQPPKKKDDDSDDKKIAAQETALMHHNVSSANNEGVVDNMSATHVTKTTDEKKSTATGTRRSSRQKRPAVFNDDVDEDADSNKKKRRRKQGGKKLMIDLKDVPMQVPILKHDGKKGGLLSKYVGVYWVKSKKKWKTLITIGGKQHYIGIYDNEEVAAINYARAVFKYKGRSDGSERLKSEQRESLDLTDVPMQAPILKHHDKAGGLSSKYLGVCWNKSAKMWVSMISIDGKQHYIGYYDSEEDAAKAYARAVFKYKGGNDGIERLKSEQRSKASLDLADVPKQQLIMKPNGKGSSTSKYLGVSLKKVSNKWRAEITIDGKKHYIGIYDNEEDAAADYARAVFKYKGGNDGIKRLKSEQRSKASKEKIDLTDVPKQQLIMKPNGKGSSTSKYLGVSFHKLSRKWAAHIMIDGKNRNVGYYDDEEDAAADYARAIFKYKGGNDGIKRLKSEQHSRASQEKLDLADVPKQQLIMKPNGKGSSTSKCTGVYWNKGTNKWAAKITIDGKNRHIGYYDNEEDAAADYARAVFKYKGGNAEVKRSDELQQPLDLIQVPAIPPAGYDPLKEGPISALM